MDEPRTIDIILHPKGGRADLLSAEDALAQLQDMIALMKAKETADGGKAHEWVIVSASTNSPLSIKLAPRMEEDEEFPEHAMDSAYSAYRDVGQLASDNVVPQWADNNVVSILERMSERTNDKIGVTEISGTDGEILFFNQQVSLSIAKNLDLLHELTNNDIGNHSSMGEVTGRIIFVGTYRRQNAFWLMLRDGQELPCTVGSDAGHQFAKTSSWEDIWKNKIIRVYGQKFYSGKGKLLRFEVKREPQVVDLKPTNLESVLDREFTAGLSSSEHLKLIRGED